MNLKHYEPKDIRILPEVKSIEDQSSAKLELTVIDKQTQQPVEAEIKFTTDEGIVINPDRNHNFELTNAENTSYYLEISVNQPTMTNQNAELLALESSLATPKTTERVLIEPSTPAPELVAPISPALQIKNRTVVMVYHAFNSPWPKSYENLDYISILLSQKPELRVEIRSHTDWLGNQEYNRILSETRAAKVRDYIIRKGIDQSRIEAMGSGDSQPIASNESGDGRRLNRRTEVSILDPTQ